MERHISGSIIGYITAYIISRRADHITTHLIWRNIENRYNQQLLADWGW